jgi:hypothetical protein
VRQSRLAKGLLRNKRHNEHIPPFVSSPQAPYAFARRPRSTWSDSGTCETSLFTGKLSDCKQARSSIALALPGNVQHGLLCLKGFLQPAGSIYIMALMIPGPVPCGSFVTDGSGTRRTTYCPLLITSEPVADNCLDGTAAAESGFAIRSASTLSSCCMFFSFSSSLHLAMKDRRWG